MGSAIYVPSFLLYNPQAYTLSMHGHIHEQGSKQAARKLWVSMSGLQLQTYLAAVGVFLDLSWEAGSSLMSIFISDETLEKEAASRTKPAPSNPNDRIRSVPDTPVKRRGRPEAKPTNDLSLGQVYHMRFMGVPVKTIAQEIGVSRRTLYRRLAEVNGKNISLDTPQPVDLLKPGVCQNYGISGTPAIFGTPTDNLGVNTP